MKILIVDDDEISRMSLSNILGGLGTVVEAEDGEQAWGLLEGGLRPAVCCCDVVMPRLDGLGLLQRTRNHPVYKNIPLILISSSSDRQTVQTAIAGGVAGYVLKPFLAVQTRTTVTRVLREHRAAQAEPCSTTRRRLSIDGAQLGKLLNKLRADVGQCQASLDAPDAAAAPLDSVLQRLSSASVALGLWRCTALLKDAQAVGPDTRQHQLLLGEVARLVDEQLREAGVQPAAAPT